MKYLRNRQIQRRCVLLPLVSWFYIWTLYEPYLINYSFVEFLLFYKVEDYYEIIKEPMDFGTMRAKLHEGMYQSFEQFEVRFSFEHFVLQVLLFSV